MPARHRPAISDRRRRARPRGRPRSSPWLPAAADRMAAAALRLVAEALRADGPERAGRRGLQRHQPRRVLQAGARPRTRSLVAMPGDDQRLRQARVVVGEAVLEPHPIRRLDRCQMRHQPSRADAAARGVADIVGDRLAIGVQAEQREGPGARRLKASSGRQRFARTAPRPSAGATDWVAARAFAQRPERRPWLSSDPTSSSQRRSKLMKLRKRLRLRIPGVLDEGREAGGQRFGQRLLAGRVERAGQQQRAGVVVDAIAMGPIRNGVDGVLEQAGVVAHGQKMPESASRAAARCASGAAARSGCATRRGRCSRRARSRTGATYRSAVSRPGHRAAAGIGALAHGLSRVRRRSASAAISAPMAAASPNGTRTPRPSASSSRACQYGVETTALPRPKL